MFAVFHSHTHTNFHLICPRNMPILYLLMPLRHLEAAQTWIV
jgi:hypothetical protein